MDAPKRVHAGGIPRKISSPDEMASLWDAYKEYCDTYTIPRTEFSQRESKHVTTYVLSPVTYTIKGFCVYIGLARKAFYDTYDKDAAYTHVIARMREDAEEDAREKFESRVIDTRLAPLWMSHYDYRLPAQRRDEDMTAAVEVLAGVLDKLGGNI